MKILNAFDWVALAVLVVGGVNWGLISLFNFDLVSSLFGEMTILTRVVYGLVGASALYVTFNALLHSADEPAVSTRVAHS